VTLRWLVATFHLLALPLGLSSVWARGRALGVARANADLARVFVADSLWGVAAALWIVTGLWRAFGSLEKGTDYYLSNRVFYVKMALLALILLLEIAPMTTLIGWRIAVRRGGEINLAPASAFARISHIQAALVVLMVFAATAMARGFFY
jgi:putative membrane protein